MFGLLFPLSGFICAFSCDSHVLMFCFRLYCMISWVMAMVVKLVWGSVFFLLFFVFMGSTWRVLDLCNLWLLWCFISLHLRHIYIHSTLPFVYFSLISLSIQPFIILTTCSTQSHKHWSLSKLILGYTLAVHHHEAKTERLTTTHLQLTITRKWIFPQKTGTVVEECTHLVNPILRNIN